MGLSKTGYKSAIHGTTKVNVPIDDNGYLTNPGASAVGTKRIQLNKTNAENTLEDNTAVLEFFLDVAGVGESQSTDTNTFAVTWEV